MNDDTDETMELLNALLDKQDGGSNKKKSIEEQKNILTDFIAQPITNFKPGDVVVRNKYGKARYRHPDANQVAVITDIFSSVVTDESDGGGGIVHANLAILTETKNKDTTAGPPVGTYTVDLRYFMPYKL